MKVKRNGVTIETRTQMRSGKGTVLEVSDGSHMFWPTITHKLAKYLEQFLEGLADE